MPRKSVGNRNVTVAGHRTSLRLSAEVWNAIDEICLRERLTIHELCTKIAERNRGRSLTTEVRVFALVYFRAAATSEGHATAGHGPLPNDAEGMTAAHLEGPRPDCAAL